MSRLPTHPGCQQHLSLLHSKPRQLLRRVHQAALGAPVPEEEGVEHVADVQGVQLVGGVLGLGLGLGLEVGGWGLGGVLACIDPRLKFSMPGMYGTKSRSAAAADHGLTVCAKTPLLAPRSAIAAS